MHRAVTAADERIWMLDVSLRWLVEAQLIYRTERATTLKS